MARQAHLVTLLLSAFMFLNTEHFVHAKPTSRPPVQPTNASELVIPGECEIFPPGECQSFTSDECVNDQQCQNIYLDYPGLKCCKNYCGIRVCDLPINVNVPVVVETHVVKEVFRTEYVCPVDTSNAECPEEADFLNECSQDSECGQLYPGWGYKCCQDSCGDRFCEQPVPRVVKQVIGGVEGLDIN